jgi:hypothetical protein
MEATCERAVRGYKPTIPPLGSKFWPLRTAVERAAFSGLPTGDLILLILASWLLAATPAMYAMHLSSSFMDQASRQLIAPGSEIVLHGPRPIALTAARSRHVVLPGGTHWPQMDRNDH